MTTGFRTLFCIFVDIETKSYLFTKEIETNCMNLYLRTSFTLFALLLSACVFISEPDVGASATGPEFSESSEMDDNRSPPGTSTDPGGMDLESGGGEPESGNTAEGDAGTQMSNDASTPSEDIGSSQDGDASIIEVDADMETRPDAQLSPVDATIGPEVDMDLGQLEDADVDPPREDCSDVEWQCSANAYCDAVGRPECALIPGAPRCYPFRTMDDTNLEAYSRCCAEAGTCDLGNFCEPDDSEYSYCWLAGQGPTCYVGPSPISDFICN
jgi:hypothetical protein